MWDTITAPATFLRPWNHSLLPMPVTRIGRLVPRSAAALARARPASRPASRRIGTLALLVLGAGCGPSVPEGVIERDTFVEAYAELRIAALRTDSSRIAASEREAILERLGITEDDLLEFVDVHAADLEYMRDVWNEVELRMDRTPESRVDGRP